MILGIGVRLAGEAARAADRSDAALKAALNKAVKAPGAPTSAVAFGSRAEPAREAAIARPGSTGAAATIDPPARRRASA